MKIIIGTDGSDFSRKAIEKCCELISNPENTSVKIISVYQQVVPLDNFAQSADYSHEVENASHKIAENNVLQAVSQFREYFPNSEIELIPEVMTGASDQAIVEEAENWNADLIVVGSHGKRFWGRVLLGSVSDSIIHHAPCSVLVVRTNEKSD